MNKCKKISSKKFKKVMIYNKIKMLKSKNKILIILINNITKIPCQFKMKLKQIHYLIIKDTSKFDNQGKN